MMRLTLKELYANINGANMIWHLNDRTPKRPGAAPKR